MSNFRFIIGDRVKVLDNSDFAPGTLGTVSIIEYIPDGGEFDFAEYTVEFDNEIENPHYVGNEDWEPQTFHQGYFTDNELDFADKTKNRKTSGFGRFIQRVESDAN